MALERQIQQACNLDPFLPGPFACSIRSSRMDICSQPYDIAQEHLQLSTAQADDIAVAWLSEARCWSSQLSTRFRNCAQYTVRCPYYAPMKRTFWSCQPTKTQGRQITIPR